jgi:hypothetical protein
MYNQDSYSVLSPRQTRQVVRRDCEYCQHTIASAERRNRRVIVNRDGWDAIAVSRVSITQEN